MSNLITMCMRCHKILHMRLVQEERWGSLLEQDDSEWRFPKLRKLVQDKAKEVGTIGQAKELVGEEFDVTYDCIDGKYYEIKDDRREIKKQKTKK